MNESVNWPEIGVYEIIRLALTRKQKRNCVIAQMTYLVGILGNTFQYATLVTSMKAYLFAL